MWIYKLNKHYLLLTFKVDCLFSIYLFVFHVHIKINVITIGTILNKIIQIFTFSIFYFQYG